MSFVALMESLLGERQAVQPYGVDLVTSKPRIAAVLDEFSSACFSGSASILPIGTMDIEMALDYFQPEFLLCESAWRGNNYAWIHQVATSGQTKPRFVELIEACRKRGIPTVFWNKEDPPHFDDFIHSAKLFDFIFTTEESVIPRYIDSGAKGTIGLLPFAAEPTIHRPERVVGHRAGNVVFAGQYFTHKFPERRLQMDFLFAAAKNRGFAIFSREQTGDARYRFPEQYERFIRGSLPYDKMLIAYRQHKVFLNVNSVPSSSSMCARRIFELSAAKTAVLSAATPAVSRFFNADEVYTARAKAEADAVLDTLLSDADVRQRSGQRAWRATLRRHTYHDRLEHIRNVIRGGFQLADRGGVHPFDERGPVKLNYAAVLAVKGLQELRQVLPSVVHQSIAPGAVWLPRGDTSPEIYERMVRIITSKLRVAVHESLEVAGPDYQVGFSAGHEYAAHYAEDLLLTFKHIAGDVVVKSVFAEHVSSIADTEKETWPEDMFVVEAQVGAWAARSKGAAANLAKLMFAQPTGRVRLEEPVYAADRFNVRTLNSRDSMWEA